MHCSILLLAVCAQLIKAGPVPYHGAFERYIYATPFPNRGSILMFTRYQNVKRFLVMTGLEPSKTEEPTSSLISTSSESLITSATSTSKLAASDFSSATLTQPISSTSSNQPTSVVVPSSTSSSSANALAHVQDASIFDTATLGAISSSETTGLASALEASTTSSQDSGVTTVQTPSSLSFVDTLSSSTSISSPASTSATEVSSTPRATLASQPGTQPAGKGDIFLADATISQSSTTAAISINPVGASNVSPSVSSTSSAIVNAVQSSSSASSATSSPPTDQQVVSASVNAIASAAIKSADASALSASSSASAAGATKSASVKYPTAENGNLAMANGYNQVFKTLGETSTCDPKDNNAATACIDGQPATCEVDGTYTLESCPQGQSCYAVPKSAGQSGVTVGCYVPSDAAEKLAAGGQAVSVTSSTSESVDTVTSQPIAIAGLSTEAVKAVDSGSITAASSTVASQTSQAQITKPETTSLLLPPPEHVQLVSSNSAPFSPSSTAIDTFQFTVASSRPASQATVFSDNPTQTISIPAGQSNPVSASTADFAQDPTTVRRGSPSSAAALVLSFPSNLPSAGPASTTRASQASVTTPTVPAPEQKDTVPSAEPFSSIDPPAGPSASATPSPTLNPGLNNGVLENNIPAATSTFAILPTTSASAAGITIVPESNSSGQATVTVTVTMTVHDRNK